MKCKIFVVCVWEKGRLKVIRGKKDGLTLLMFDVKLAWTYDGLQLSYLWDKNEVASHF
mgnify:CR=1 FL=1